MKKKIYYLLIALFIFFPGVVNAKSMDNDFMKTYGTRLDNSFNKIAQTDDGGFIAVGRSSISVEGAYTNYGDDDGLIAKFSKDGSIEWQHNFGGTGFDLFTGVTIDDDGNYIATGYYYSPTVNNGLRKNYGEADIMTVKYSKTGEILNTVYFCSTLPEFTNDIIATSDGGFLLIGQQISGRKSLGLVVKYGSDFKRQWYYNFGSNTGDDYLISAIEYGDGYLLAGYSTSKDAMISNNGLMDGMLITVQSNGLSKNYINIGGSGNDFINSISKTSDGGFILSGSSTSNDFIDSSDGKKKAFILKYDNNLTKSWIKSNDTSGSDEYYDCYQTKDLGYVCAGAFESVLGNNTNKGAEDAAIVKYDKNGNIILTSSYGTEGRDEFRHVVEDKSNPGNFYVVGSSKIIDTYGNFIGLFGKFSIKYDIKANVVSNTNSGRVVFSSKFVSNKRVYSLSFYPSEGFSLDKVLINGVAYSTDKIVNNELLLDSLSDDAVVNVSYKKIEGKKDDNQNNLDNPKTIDNIFLYLVCFIMTGIGLLISYYKYRKIRSR